MSGIKAHSESRATHSYFAFLLLFPFRLGRLDVALEPSIEGGSLPRVPDASCFWQAAVQADVQERD